VVVKNDFSLFGGQGTRNNEGMSATPPTRNLSPDEPSDGSRRETEEVLPAGSEPSELGFDVPMGHDRSDFEALYEKYSREVWAMAYARWMNADTAMDITQETFLRLWKQWEAGETILNPRAWLLRVARNLAEDNAKSAFRRNGTHPPQTMNGVQAHDPDPLEKMEREEVFSRVRGLLEELPVADREILSLRYTHEYDTNEIAEYLGINTTAVHMRLSRARQRLADRLKAQGVGQLP
jgi:RNA polymerase sigma-70 factor, ECF subfamily